MQRRRRKRKKKILDNSISKIKQVELKEEKEFVFRGSSWWVPGEERKRKGLRPISPLHPCFKYPEHVHTHLRRGFNIHQPTFSPFLDLSFMHNPWIFHVWGIYKIPVSFLPRDEGCKTFYLSSCINTIQIKKRFVPPFFIIVKMFRYLSLYSKLAKMGQVQLDYCALRVVPAWFSETWYSPRGETWPARIFRTPVFLSHLHDISKCCLGFLDTFSFFFFFLQENFLSRGIRCIRWSLLSSMNETFAILAIFW